MPKTVLVCDDEQYILETVSFVIQREGYEVISAETGEEGLRLARERKPALLLLDVMLPGLSGFDVCREVKSDPAMSETRVVLFTAKGQESDREEGQRCGADDYINKPIGSRELRKRLHELLD